jgi:hypothetical protein
MDPKNRHTPNLLGGAAAEPRKRRLASRPAIDQQGRACFKPDENLIGLTGVTEPKAEKYTVEDPVFSTVYARRSR